MPATRPLVTEFLPREYLRPDDEPFYIAKHRKIEIVFLIEATGYPLFRTEGEESFNKATIFVDGEPIDVPVILPEKIKARLRRDFLELLRKYYDDLDEGVKKKILEVAGILGYKKVASTGKWYCAIIPPGEGGKGETDAGLCGMCPHCLLFGVILTKENSAIQHSVGVKSRVLVDPAFAVVSIENALEGMMHNRVGDGETASTTGQSLYRSYHVRPGVVFVGKIVLSDVSAEEALMTLYALSGMTRLGGRETVYGSVRVRVLGVAGGLRERVSAYELASRILAETRGLPAAPDSVAEKLREYLRSKGFAVLSGSEFAREPDKELVARLWIRALKYDADILEFASTAKITGSLADKVSRARSLLK